MKILLKQFVISLSFILLVSASKLNELKKERDALQKEKKIDFNFKSKNKEKMSLEKLLDSKYNKIIKENKKEANVIDDFSFDSKPKQNKRKARFDLKNEMIKEKQIDALDKELLSMHKKPSKDKTKKRELVVDNKGHQLLKESVVTIPAKKIAFKRNRKLKPEKKIIPKKKATLKEEEPDIINKLKKQQSPSLTAPVVLKEKEVEQTPVVAVPKVEDENIRSLKNNLMFRRENQIVKKNNKTGASDPVKKDEASSDNETANKPYIEKNKGLSTEEKPNKGVKVMITVMIGLFGALLL